MQPKPNRILSLLFFAGLLIPLFLQAQENTFYDLRDVVQLKYNNPDLVVDLGVGLWAWPLPFDIDDDGDFDLVVSSGGSYPFNGLYYFENKTDNENPLFKKPIRVGEGLGSVTASYIDGKPRILGPGIEFSNFKTSFFDNPEGIFPASEVFAFVTKKRLTEWKYVDFENDGDLDILVGIDDWADYGWDNAFDKTGKWTNGPLHGYVILIENIEGKYRVKGKLEAGGLPIDVFGTPSPNMNDFDGDGDLDLICGEFVDKLTWFENIGTRENPEFAAGRFLENGQGILKMHLEMIVPVAVDWDNDGDIDLVVGDEDGRVALIKNTGQTKNRMPVFESPEYFKQEADNLKFGALSTPFSVDWDNDGDEDLICGNSSGEIAFIENLDGGNPPKWNAPELLTADGKPIRIMAGKNGSIQGPCEEKWGYTTLSVADWNNDGLLDIIVNSIWGKIEWFKNVGSKTNPQLTAMGAVKIDWQNEVPKKPEWNWWEPKQNEMVTQWRTTPVATDWNNDGLMDLVMLDYEGYLAFFERFQKKGELFLHPGQRIFLNGDEKENPALRLNDGFAGQSGRRKIALTDWDSDGDIDLLVNTTNTAWYENSKEENGKTIFKYRGNIMQVRLGGHSTSPAVTDRDKDGIPEIIVGAEDGHFYYFKRKNQN